MSRGNPVLKVARYRGREASLKLRNVRGSKGSEGWSQSSGKLSPSRGFKSKRPEFSSCQPLLAVCPWASHYSSLASVCSSVEWANTGSGFPAFLRGPDEVIYEKHMSAQYLAHCLGLSISFFSPNPIKSLRFVGPRACVSLQALWEVKPCRDLQLFRPQDTVLHVPQAVVSQEVHFFPHFSASQSPSCP